MSFILLGIAFSGHLISLPDEAVDKGFFWGLFWGLFWALFGHAAFSSTLPLIALVNTRRSTSCTQLLGHIPSSFPACLLCIIIPPLLSTMYT